jgi:hypothetical protein
MITKEELEHLKFVWSMDWAKKDDNELKILINPSDEEFWLDIKKKLEENDNNTRSST